jgi:transposase
MADEFGGEIPVGPFALISGEEIGCGFGATKESEMAAGDIVPVPGAQFEETLASASPDLLRAMIREFAQRMMDADVEVACNAGYGEVTPERVNSRNGYRRRERDTRARTIELAIPELRQGSYFPGFLEHRRRAGRALAPVVATSYLLGVSIRRVENLAASPGVTGLSRSQVSATPDAVRHRGAENSADAGLGRRGESA